MTVSREVRRADAVIIGTGQAAPALATALAQRGEQVVVFEGGAIGGSCVNVGCTPTKTLRKSARVAHMVARASEFGVHVGDVRVDFAAAMERVESIISASRAGLTRWMESADGVSIVQEWAKFAGREEDGFLMQSDTMKVVAPRVYLNTGTRPRIPSIPGLADTPYLTNETILALRERPEHLVILGGSYIGLEMAQIFRRLGSAVTVIEDGVVVAGREDRDVAERVAELLASEGVTLLTNHVLAQVEHSDAVARATLMFALHTQDKATGNAQKLLASHLLVATGRLPNTERLGLDTVGVATDDQGYVPVNGQLETNVSGIWALGDVNRRGAFTHTSFQDQEIVLANHTGDSRSADGRITSYAMFTDPPLGRVGLSATEARQLARDGRRFLMATHEMRNVSRAKEESETVGVIKVLVDAESDRFVGATVFGIGGDEVVQVIGAMIAADAPYQVLRDALPIHPTVTEFFPTILKKLAPLTE